MGHFFTNGLSFTGFVDSSAALRVELLTKARVHLKDGLFVPWMAVSVVLCT